jgi:hypothetical protein
MAQIHVHSSEQRVPQKSGIHGRRRNCDGVGAPGAGVANSLHCVIYSAVKRIARTNVEPRNPGRLGVRKTLACFRRATFCTNRNPVLSSEPTICTLPQFLETNHAHA